jgi:plasmid stabilization system protein ParE
MPHFRDIIIPFGSSGYVPRYRIEYDTVLIVAVKHGEEADHLGPEVY